MIFIRAICIVPTDYLLDNAEVIFLCGKWDLRS